MSVHVSLKNKHNCSQYDRLHTAANAKSNSSDLQADSSNGQSEN